MDYEDITCVLGLTALVCFGFLFVALALLWPNEANVYLMVFCLANGVLAVLGVFEAKKFDSHCRWSSLLRMFALTLGFDVLYRNQVERSRMMARHFKLYNMHSIYSQLFRSSLSSCATAFALWNHYGFLPELKTCFIKPSGFAHLEETLLNFFWVLFFYLRPVAMTIRWIPHVMYQSSKQIQVLNHEKKLNLNTKLLLYKDHQRRLYHVIMALVTQVIFVTWVLLTLPYVLQILGAVAGLSAFIRLDEFSPGQITMFAITLKSVPIASCFLLVMCYVIYYSVKLK